MCNCWPFACGTIPRFAATLDDGLHQDAGRSAPLHDIGKVGIPDSILQKPGKLTAEEWVIMKTHSRLGSDAIDLAERDIDRRSSFSKLAKEVARWHHERWDGKGYPDGLAEEAIPISARLMTLADVFDALISKRVYKDAMPDRQRHGRSSPRARPPVRSRCDRRVPLGLRGIRRDRREAHG
jgi:putative two-component system response regulator